MNALIVYTHPEPESLNGYLKNSIANHLQSMGYRVIVSDLYKMNWKAVANTRDFKDFPNEKRLFYIRESKRAYDHGMQTLDIEKEQDKLMWADVVIFQFPLWWFGMPALLKGWIDRVFACGFAYGVGKYGGKHWGKRYGEGTLNDKKAMLSLTIGGRKAQFGKRGINGYIDDLLFPIQHGMFWYAGMSVLPPHILYQSDRATPEEVAKHTEQLKQRLNDLSRTPPIPYRYQNYGDYDDEQQLKNGSGQLTNGFSIYFERENKKFHRRKKF